MAEIIIIVILIVAVLSALRSTLKHFRGEGGCCGGSSVKVPKKQLNGKISQKYVLHIDGMHCQSCANSVMQSVNCIDGVSATVSLRKKRAIIYCDRPVEIEMIINAIEQTGYKASIKSTE